MLVSTLADVGKLIPRIPRIRVRPIARQIAVRVVRQRLAIETRLPIVEVKRRRLRGCGRQYIRRESATLADDPTIRVISIRKVAQLGAVALSVREAGQLAGRVIAVVDRDAIRQRERSAAIVRVIRQLHCFATLRDRRQAIGIVVGVASRSLRRGGHAGAPAGRIIRVADAALRAASASHSVETVITPAQRTARRIDQAGQAVAGVVIGLHTGTIGVRHQAAPIERVVADVGHLAFGMSKYLTQVVIGPRLALVHRIRAGDQTVAAGSNCSI